MEIIGADRCVGLSGVEGSVAVGAEVLVYLQPFFLNSLVYKSEFFSILKNNSLTLGVKLLKVVYFPTFYRLHCILASAPTSLQKLPLPKPLVFFSL